MFMPSPSTVELIAAAIFALAVLHTFSTRFFVHMSKLQPQHAGLWHLMGEVEVVFGFWAFVLAGVLFFAWGKTEAVRYLDGRDFTEPLFVFVIMVIAATRPILHLVLNSVHGLARLLPLARPAAIYFLCLAAVPLLGSFITEPAAMTLAAILLRDTCYAAGVSTRMKYVTLGILFVNVSIGGTLTNFAAPPVLMVAAKWQWDSIYMMSHFGWKAALAVLLNALAATWYFRNELIDRAVVESKGGDDRRMPWSVVLVHVLFLGAVVTFSHHPVIFMGVFLLFLGFTEAYPQHQDRLFLREGLLVAFFLAGLVTLGGLQKWWLQPALSGVDGNVLFFLTTGLTAITDNAALTYLGSMVDGLTPELKYALVAGAVTGGGLTVIANAPNPAGFSILKGHFPDGAISPPGLFLAALLPTGVAMLAFLIL